MVKHFIIEFLKVFYSPKTLYQNISDGKKSRSWICVLVYCFIYVVGSLWLYMKDFTPVVKPWIVLSHDIYYLVQAFYIIPLVFLMWILGTGVIHIVSKKFNGRGNFDTLFVMTGYALWAPWYPLIVVDCIHSTPEWLYNTVLGVCMILLLIETTLAAIIEEKINWSVALFSSGLAVISIGLILFTYIR